MKQYMSLSSNYIIFNYIVSYAPGGTGKTFLLNTLLAEIRGSEQIAIASAFVGVAAMLLEGGTTVHKRFKIITQGANISVRHHNVILILSE